MSLQPSAHIHAKNRGLQIVVLVLIAFLFFLSMSGSREGFQIRWPRLTFVANVLVASLFIGFVLLPKFYYRRKYWAFALSAFLSIIVAIVIEEFVLEKIFFPDGRGSHFMGFFINFMRMLPLVMLFVGVKLAWDAALKDRQLIELKSKVTESQLKTLKAQINPHFLFNSLNNLYSFALEGSAQTPGIILGLSDILRYMIYDCSTSKVALSKELEVLQQYVDLQKLQIGHRGHVNFDIQGDPRNLEVAPLLFIVFVENSFKHSTASQSSGILIDISISIQSDQVRMLCHNSHEASQKTSIGLDNGVGLDNVRQRLDILYPDKHRLIIQPGHSSYSVELNLDLS